MSYDLVPAVQTVFEVNPQLKKDNFDRAMEVAGLFLNTPVATVCNCISDIFQTFALMQGRKEARKIVRYTTSLEEVRTNAAIEMKKIELEQYRTRRIYDLQEKTLTLYVDKKYQQTVDQITRKYHEESFNIHRERDRAFRKIDDYTKKSMSEVDYRYCQLMRDEELVCAAYREMLKKVSNQGGTITIAGQILTQAIQHSSELSDKRFEMVMDIVSKMTQYSYDSYSGYSASFDNYISLEGQIQRIGDNRALRRW